jgi:hypothetical protein
MTGATGLVVPDTDDQNHRRATPSIQPLEWRRFDSKAEHICNVGTRAIYRVTQHCCERDPMSGWYAEARRESVEGDEEQWQGGLKFEVRHRPTCKVSPKWEPTTRT